MSVSPVQADRFESQGEHFILLPWRQMGEKRCVSMLFDVDNLADGMMPTEMLVVLTADVRKCGNDARKIARLMQRAVDSGLARLRKRRVRKIEIAS